MNSSLIWFFFCLSSLLLVFIFCLPSWIEGFFEFFAFPISLYFLYNFPVWFGVVLVFLPFQPDFFLLFLPFQFENELITKLDQEVEGGRGDEQYKILLEKLWVLQSTWNLFFFLFSWAAFLMQRSPNSLIIPVSWSSCSDLGAVQIYWGWLPKNEFILHF